MKRRRAPRGDTQGELFGRRDAPTLKRIVAFYVDDYLVAQARADTTIATQRGPLEYLAKVLPPFPTAGEVRKAIQRKIDGATGDRPIGEATANQYRKYLSHAYEHARNEWPTIAVRNVARAFPPWRVPRRRPRAMADPQVTFRRLLEEACADDGERSLLCALCMLGLRIGEARGVVIAEDLTRDLHRLTVRRQRKGALERELKTDASCATFDVPDEMRTYLRGWLRQRTRDLALGADDDSNGQRRKYAASPYLWPYGNRWLRGSLMPRIRAVAPDDFPTRRAGIGGVAFHGFRDTLGALLALGGASVHDGQRALRHASPTTTGGYFNQVKGHDTTNAHLQQAQVLLSTPAPTRRRKLRIVD